ncbi:MAG: GNAT family N-acetyltransferase [Saccharospirillaceae bacterium]|nr:GNAT family N-acetyltransferase [Pseudomonadales bacterium]NRB81269.1 GNAT family N-acetyltransferase [Saccharospirillaceae bacterium]
MNFNKIEKSGFRSWPALEESENNGIVLRFSNGYTKRANSANVIKQQKNNFEFLVDQYEKYFKAKNLPCIFRLPSFSNNKKLDNYLEDRGYKSIGRSLILCRSLVNSDFNDTNITEKNRIEWMLSYCRINEINIDKQTTHLEMLKRIKDKVLMVVLKVDEVEVACGLGVISDDYFGLFDIATKKSARNKGYATKLLDGMLRWAVENGASFSYLQVVAENQAAIKLYKKFGYQHGYEYCYRINQKD